MNYIVLPSLKNAALVKTALLFYNDCETKSIIRQGKSSQHSRELVEMKVAEKLTSLLPSSLFKTVAEVLLCMHHEVGRWREDHRFLLNYIGPSCCIWLSWKTNGTINKIQTAKKIVGNPNIDTKIRFIVACTYFLEEDVSALWKGFSGVDKMEVCRGETSEAVRFWMKWLNEENNKHWSEIINENLGIPLKNFKFADIPLRLSSFYPFLSWENKKQYFYIFQFGLTHRDDLQECVNKMNESERTEMYNSNSVHALWDFLDWPFRSVFLKIASNLFTNLTPLEFANILIHMLETYASYGHEDFHLLEEFWRLRPADLKENMHQHHFEMPNIEIEKYPKIFNEILSSVFD